MVKPALFPQNVTSHEYAKAVIDIGSNSVRMVVYHAICRVPIPSFNEKYYCELGRSIEETGKLYEPGVKKAKAALARFKLMAERMGISDITIIATAAMRDASDGQNFIDEIEAELGLNIQLISGEREAELAAKGIMASVYHPKGICADLGGGSVELALVEDHSIMKQESLPIGGLRLANRFANDTEALRAHIQEVIGAQKWITKQPTVYAIGGSFRSIAKMFIKQQQYPLPILHEFTMNDRQLARIAEHFSHLGVAEIGDLPGVPRKRAATMLPAVIVLHEIMKKAGAKQVMFSVSGIREGLLYDRLDEEAKREDPLFASAKDLALLAGRHGNYADELFQWMSPLFYDESMQHKRVRYALCILSELAWTIDPNFRSEWAFNRVIQSAIKGVTHRERVMLSMALYHRYQVKWKQERDELKLLDERDRLWAKCIGMAANLAFHVSGGKHGNLHHAALKVQDDQVDLILDQEASPLRTDTVEKRLEGLGSAFNALSSFVI
ncbi:MAG: Ppx/GppA family phosphatase [Rickettsiales bacterium]|nr:Ppx/GppA family phosphatase [Rickettsiales bacterium]